MVRTSMGPNGMNKMVINHLERLFVTSDARTIVTELEVQHPAGARGKPCNDRPPLLLMKDRLRSENLDAQRESAVDRGEHVLHSCTRGCCIALSAAFSARLEMAADL